MLLLFLCYKGEEKALNLSMVVQNLHTFIMSPVTHLLSKENTWALNFFLCQRCSGFSINVIVLLWTPLKFFNIPLRWGDQPHTQYYTIPILTHSSIMIMFLFFILPHMHPNILLTFVPIRCALNCLQFLSFFFKQYS